MLYLLPDLQLGLRHDVYAPVFCAYPLFLAKIFSEVVNLSANQTLARSINTSVTTLITLLALYFFGGVTTRNFVLAMILGIAIGTYSSIFFASTLLALWHDIQDSKRINSAETV